MEEEEEERNNVCDLTVRNGESERAGEEERRKPFTAIKCPRMMGGRKKGDMMRFSGSTRQLFYQKCSSRVGFVYNERGSVSGAGNCERGTKYFK